MNNCPACPCDENCQFCMEPGCVDCFHAPGRPDLDGLCEDCQFDAFDELEDDQDE